jgi:glycosyltransferase involved in cell wall biosynthesis
MRIPFEGMVAAQALDSIRVGGGNSSRAPLLISVWGNDFTLHAKSSSQMASYTRQALNICDGLHVDCQRDLNLARELGFASAKPGIIVPAGGGIKMDIFFPLKVNQKDDGNSLQVGNPPMTIINPRGFRAYVRNDTFFKAIPLVLRVQPNARFICPGMLGESQAQKWIKQLGVRENVELLPPQSHQRMAELFRRSQISLSITTHDGTPNSLLEAMACGCFPIAGDIESIREWITPGENGLLVDPSDPDELASAILACASQPELRKNAQERNLQLVRERAEYHQTILAAEKFYRHVAGQ